MTSARLCCCVTCGLPASGKTSLCKIIQELATVQSTLCGKQMVVVHICFDDIIPEITLDSGWTLDHSLWKEYRRKILECLDYIFKELQESEATLSQIVEQLQQDGRLRSEGHESGSECGDMAQMWDKVWSSISTCLSEATFAGAEAQKAQQILFLMDDNMFYRSMRYEYCQLARKHCSGFCQIGLECSLQTAMDRNSKRIHGIPKETVTKMAEKIELPDASKASWESNSILIDACDPFDHAILAPVWMLIQSAFESPLAPMQEEDTEAKELSRAECLASVLHQADQALRKCIADIMGEAKGDLSKQDMKDLATHLSMSKKAILESVRAGDLVPPPVPLSDAPRHDFDAFFQNCLSKK